MLQVGNDYQSLLTQAVEKAKADPRWFFDNILRFQENGELCTLDWQVEATEAVLDARRPPDQRKVNHAGLDRVTIRSCHGTGKTQWLGLLTHLESFITYDKIAATAPKQAQITKRLFPNIRRATRNAIPEWKSIFNVLTQEVKVADDPDWGLVAETASEPDNLAGLHPLLFMVDEAAARRLDPMYQVIYGALTRPGAVLVEIGNPTRIEGEFYNHHCKTGVKEIYHRMHIKQQDAPTLITEQWVQNYIKTYGLNSPITKIRALGEFAAFDDYTLIPLEYIEDSFDIEEMTDGSLPRLRVSVDVADGGDDSTVITVGRIYDTFTQIVKQKQFYFNPTESPIKAAEAAESMFDGYGGSTENGDEIVVDAIGVGAGTAGLLMKKNYNVIAYKGGEASDDNNRWRNRRVQSYIALYEAFRDGRVRISPGAIDNEEEFRAHLISVKRRVNNERVDDLEPKERIKQDGLPSPDRADSMAMMYARMAAVMGKGGTPHLLGTMESTNYD